MPMDTSQEHQESTPSESNLLLRKASLSSTHLIEEYKDRFEGVDSIASTSNVTILSLCATLDGCDEQLFPASLKAIERDLKFSPVDLGVCSFVQTIAFALFSPVWALLAETKPRNKLLAIGCLLWGICTVLLGIESRYPVILILRFFNGLALACVSPIAIATFSEVSNENRRGMMFSFIVSCKNLGRLFSSYFTTAYAMTWVSWSGGWVGENGERGMHGWRVVFVIVGLLSIVFSVCVYFYLHIDPEGEERIGEERRGEERGGEKGEREALPILERENYDSCLERREEREWDFGSFISSVQMMSIYIITLIEIFYAISIGALSYIVLWLQMNGISDQTTAWIVSLRLFLIIIFSPLAGFICDKMHLYYSSKGRIILSQIFALLVLPFYYYLFFKVPEMFDVEKRVFSSTIILGIIAIFSCFMFAGSKPLIAELISPSYRISTICYIDAIEITFRAIFGYLLVGFLIKYYGYDKDNAQLTKNAIAISKACSICVIIPSICCFLLYFLLYIYIDQDRKRARLIFIQQERQKINQRKKKTLESRSVSEWNA